jgi:hypothetical protein
MATKQIKIRVLVNSNGDWAAYSWSDSTPDDCEEVLFDMMGDKDVWNVQFVNVVVDIPVPEEATVEGQVEA